MERTIANKHRNILAEKHFASKNFFVTSVVFVLLTLFLLAILPELKITSTSEIKMQCLLFAFVSLFWVAMWCNITRKMNSIFFFFLLYTIFTNGGQVLLYAFNVNAIMVERDTHCPMPQFRACLEGVIY